MKTTGKVTGIISNLVTVTVDGPVAQNEICFIKLGDAKLMAEVIKVTGKSASVQVYESTRGLKNGDIVEFEGHMLEVELGPGLLSSNYDGLQNNLATMEDVFLKRGEYTLPIDLEKEWEFTPSAKEGDVVIAADWLGEVKEGWLPHKIMVPFAFQGNYTVKSIAKAGNYKAKDTVAVLVDANGEEHAVSMVQKWAVKVPITNYKEKPRPFKVGAFKFAVSAGVPVIPMFITMEDTDKIGGDGFPIQAHTVHIGECLWPDEKLSAKENVNMLMEKNYQFCVDTYERVYNTKLKFNIKEEK